MHNLTAPIFFFSFFLLQKKKRKMNFQYISRSWLMLVYYHDCNFFILMEI
jgi:hypothetical protein